MTNEEATIQALKRHIQALQGRIKALNETIENQNKVIKALEQEPCEDCISRQIMGIRNKWLKIIAMFNVFRPFSSKTG